MPSTMTNVSVRLPQHTLDLLEQLMNNSIRLPLAGYVHNDHRPYNRSELIRFAISAGLDAITGPPPTRSLELKKCQSGKPHLPTISDDPDSASSGPLPPHLSLPMSSPTNS